MAGAGRAINVRLHLSNHKALKLSVILSYLYSISAVGKCIFSELQSIQQLNTASSLYQ